MIFEDTLYVITPYNLYKAAAIMGLCSHEQMIFPQVLADKAHEIALAAIKAEGTNNGSGEECK